MKTRECTVSSLNVSWISSWSQARSENGCCPVACLGQCCSPLECKEREMCLPTAHSFAADTRMFFLACPFDVISLHICFINYSRISLKTRLNQKVGSLWEQDF